MNDTCLHHRNVHGCRKRANARAQECGSAVLSFDGAVRAMDRAPHIYLGTPCCRLGVATAVVNQPSRDTASAHRISSRRLTWPRESRDAPIRYHGTNRTFQAPSLPPIRPSLALITQLIKGHTDGTISVVRPSSQVLHCTDGHYDCHPPSETTPLIFCSKKDYLHFGCGTSLFGNENCMLIRARVHRVRMVY